MKDNSMKLLCPTMHYSVSLNLIKTLTLMFFQIFSSQNKALFYEDAFINVHNSVRVFTLLSKQIFSETQTLYLW